jgi:ankyrin repeat protein
VSLLQAVIKQDELLVKKLLSEDASIDEIDDEGNSVFILAIKNGLPLELIVRLVDMGADPFATSDTGVGAIDIAIESTRLDVVKYLHSLGLDLNQSKRESKMTPLMVAACYNRVEIAKYLIMQDVDVDKTDINGLRAVDYARKLGQNEIAQFLMQVQ